MPTYLDKLNAKFPGNFTTSAFRDNHRVIVSAEKAPEVLFPLLKCLKEECGFDMLAELGGSRRAGVWAMLFYGLGSSAFVYAKGDFAQPLEGLCWVAAFLAAARFRRTGARRDVWLASAAVWYAVRSPLWPGWLGLRSVCRSRCSCHRRCHRAVVWCWSQIWSMWSVGVRWLMWCHLRWGRVREEQT